MKGGDTVADLSTIEQALRRRYASASANADAQRQEELAKLQALQDSYANALAQAQGKLASIPDEYDAKRRDAALTRLEALAALPERTLNDGYAPGSGRSKTLQSDVDSVYGRTMSNVGAAQQSALQSERNAVATLGVNYRNSLAKLLAKFAAG